tara:strand:- start:3682 stop:4020 length:339 start_codon:yes stop_codon:yes gene_type:complete
MKKIPLLLLIAILAVSCQSESGKKMSHSTTWRAHNILNGHLVIVENDLRLPLLAGDTVCVGNSNTNSNEFNILNVAQLGIDTVQYDMYVANGDTTFVMWECHNVVLEQKIIK